MKNLLIIPGVPLLVLILALHDESSPVSVFLLCLATAILTFGAALILFYSLARIILSNIPPK